LARPLDRHYGDTEPLELDALVGAAEPVSKAPAKNRFVRRPVAAPVGGGGAVIDRPKGELGWNLPEERCFWL